MRGPGDDDENSDEFGQSDHSDLNVAGDELRQEYESGSLDSDEYDARLQELRDEEAQRNDSGPPEWADDED